MVGPRGPAKAERVTITFMPIGDERNLPSVPTTFSSSIRSYQWRRMEQLQYMIVPRKISNTEFQVDLYLSPLKRGKLGAKDVERVVQTLMSEKSQTEWRGLRLTGISRPTVAKPPQKTIIRGTIEEILGSTH